MVDEAIRRHLRPELVNRLTKVVHFKPPDTATVREILVKLLVDFNRRLAHRGVTVELDEGAGELILREGFSEKHGARILERAVDRLLGTPLGGLHYGTLAAGVAAAGAPAAGGAVTGGAAALGTGSRVSGSTKVVAATGLPGRALT